MHSTRRIALAIVLACAGCSDKSPPPPNPELQLRKELEVKPSTNSPAAKTGPNTDRLPELTAQLRDDPATEATGFTAQQAVRLQLAADPAAAKALAEAEAQWIARAVERAIGVAQKSLDAGVPADAVTAMRTGVQLLESVRAFSMTDPTVKASCRRLVAASLEAAGQRGMVLIRAGRYNEAEKAADKLVTDLREPAAAVGLSSELSDFRDGYAYLAELSRLANK